MKKKVKGKRMLIWIFITAAILVFITAVIYVSTLSKRMDQATEMNFAEMVTYTTKNDKKACITVGVIKNGEMSFTVYGNNASVLPQTEFTYEIGSISKTFTASLLSKAISEGKANLQDPIDRYIDLPERDGYPTLKELVTHTSGYDGHYAEWQMVKNVLTGQQNGYYGIDEETLVKKLGTIELKHGDHPFRYSNFGFATLGSVLEGVYDADYTILMNDFIMNEMQLKHTRISDGSGELRGYWKWKTGDAYIPAGAITSTISDMMQYISMQMADEIPYLPPTHSIVKRVDATTVQYEKLNIHLDAVGMSWIIDLKNNLVWHNGGTTNFNSYAAFDEDRQIGVVILSNRSPIYRLPATVLGAQLMRELQN